MTPGTHTPQSPEAMQAVILERLDGLSRSVDEIKAEIKEHPRAYISRDEWRVWSDTRDREFKDLRESVKVAAAAAAAAASTAETATALVKATDRAEEKADRRRPNWTAIAMAAIAGMALLINLVPRLAGG